MPRASLLGLEGASRACDPRARSRIGPGTPGRQGRTSGLSAGLIVVLLLLGYAALRVFELAPRSAPVAPPAAEVEPPAPKAWRARVKLGEAEVVARLLPLHGEPALEEFRAHALRARYALPEGEPWRLYLSLAQPSATPVVVDSARVGRELVPFAEVAPAREGLDPVHALFAAAPGALEVEHARPMVLWGRLETGTPELELASGELLGSGALALEDGSDAPRWYAGTARPRAEAGGLEAEVARLQRELDRERARRAEREQAFLEFSRLLGELPAGKQLGLGPAEVAGSPPPSPEEAARLEAEEKARTRAAELGRALGVLMRLEGLRGLDLLEAGTLLPGPPPAIGPVVFRCLDERGGLTGSVRAERLRLEASQAAHMLTLVLEEGFESRGGERVPFADGVRRITLPDVDPEPWLEDCPELFDSSAGVGPNDDGRWSVSAVRRELNRLLALDTRLGWYRLHSLGGVRGTELFDVQLEEFEPGGRRARRMFADRMRLALEDGSVVLELRDGAHVRGSEKQPFRDGLHRIVLPTADVALWRASALPGFADPPARETPPEETAAEVPPPGG
jgi:hypothetical protein